MWVDERAEGSSLQTKLLWVADWSYGGELVVFCMQNDRKSTRINKQNYHFRDFLKQNLGFFRLFGAFYDDVSMT